MTGPLPFTDADDRVVEDIEDAIDEAVALTAGELAEHLERVQDAYERSVGWGEDL